MQIGNTADKPPNSTKLYSTFSRLLFAPQIDQKPLPQHFIAIQDLRINTLAAYRLVPNAVGLPWEISLNAKYLHRPIWEQAESLLHETIHLYQEDGASYRRERFPGQPMKSRRGRYHSQQFVELCEEVGLHPILGHVAHWRPGDGQFERLMVAIGIPKPDHAKSEFMRLTEIPIGNKFWWDADRGERKGESTLLLYTGERCKRTPICKVRSGRRDLDFSCNTCGSRFLPQG